jgi:hypothetical protein
MNRMLSKQNETKCWIKKRGKTVRAQCIRENNCDSKKNTKGTASGVKMEAVSITTV